MKNLLKKLALSSTMFAMVATPVLAAPPGAQLVEVYDDTDDGLQVDTDADIGNVEFVANPGGQGRLVIQTHLQKVAPNCTFNVELVRDSAALNGGLNEFGHTGGVQVLGQLTTNKAGNGNAHFDVEVGDGELDVQAFGHLDFEPVGECTDSDGDLVGFNQYGAASVPNVDPLLNTPLTWMQ